MSSDDESTSLSSGSTDIEPIDKTYKLKRSDVPLSSVKRKFPDFDYEDDRYGCFGAWTVVSKFSMDVRVRHALWKPNQPSAKRFFKDGRARLMHRDDLPMVMRALVENDVSPNKPGTDYSLVAPATQERADLDEAYECLADAQKALAKALGR